MSHREAMFMPLCRAFAMTSAHTLRNGRKLPGMSYSDRELSEAIDAAAAAKAR